MVLPEAQNPLCAILLMKSKPQKIFCPRESMAQGGCSWIASCLLSLRALFWHRVSHEQLQRSRDGPAIASWRDECGNECQEKEIASRVLCPGHVLVGKGWQVAPVPSVEGGSSFFRFIICWISAQTKLTKYFHTWSLTSAPAQVWYLCHTSPSATFEDFLQKLHQKPLLFLLQGSKDNASKPLGNDHPPWPWPYPVSIGTQTLLKMFISCREIVSASEYLWLERWCVNMWIFCCMGCLCGAKWSSKSSEKAAGYCRHGGEDEGDCPSPAVLRGSWARRNSTCTVSVGSCKVSSKSSVFTPLQSK